MPASPRHQLVSQDITVYFESPSILFVLKFKGRKMNSPFVTQKIPS